MPGPHGSWLPGFESTGLPGSGASLKPACCRAADRRASAAFETRTRGRGEFCGESFAMSEAVCVHRSSLPTRFLRGGLGVPPAA
eukprot:CAMPEP_0179354772 /NCGR_PEP_ID=MMETSP0797-20121207/77023_1 /TAXON_ID=47934 /ORGANISM="Dinophysis acuminata, Strain DAEP01" /LENGTH=83 /DNA_ID=CAMNT_0021069885 /DNA_START=393 /DNA_END=640 /DNA_ORIENTATION=+